MDTTVLISGAGPTGLVLAATLARQGVGVRVIDRASGPATTSRALGLQPRGVEVLDRLAALGDLRERALPISTVTMRTGHGTAGPELTLNFGDLGRTGHKDALLISQAAIEEQLRKRLADLGVHVEWGRELTAGVQDDAHVTATVRGTDGDETVRTAWLAGCDGAHSAVRKIAGIDFPGAKIVDNTLLADVRAAWPLSRTGTTVYLDEHGMFGIFPLPGGVWRLFAPAPADFPDDAEDEAVLEVCRDLVRTRLGQPPESITGVEWVSTFRIHRRLADQYRSGRMLLAGDAAHIHSPTGGQGMNTGIGDAENLGFKLALVARGQATEALLDTYATERRPLAETVLRSTTMATRIIFAGRSTFLRDRLVFPLARWSRLQRALWWRASQLGVHYRRGPLTPRGHTPGPGPRPGERVPDLACHHPDGTPTRLHAELGSRWALLCPSGPAAEDSMRARLGADVVVLRHNDQRLRQAVLVRPDAHLAWRGDRDDRGVVHWLDAVLSSGTAR